MLSIKLYQESSVSYLYILVRKCENQLFLIDLECQQFIHAIYIFLYENACIVWLHIEMTLLSVQNPLFIPYIQRNLILFCYLPLPHIAICLGKTRPVASIRDRPSWFKSSLILLTIQWSRYLFVRCNIMSLAYVGYLIFDITIFYLINISTSQLFGRFNSNGLFSIVSQVIHKLKIIDINFLL